MSAEQTHETLVPRLVKVLRRPKRLRTGELLQAAKVQDRRVGEDVVWMLVKQGKVVIGPDSTLRLTEAGSARRKSR